MTIIRMTRRDGNKVPMTGWNHVEQVYCYNGEFEVHVRPERFQAFRAVCNAYQAAIRIGSHPGFAAATR